MKILTQLTLASLLSLSLIASACTTLNQPSLDSKIIEFTSDASGFNTKTIFYVGEREVVAFDSQFTAKHANNAIKHLRKHTHKPISWLVITHPNPDKFNAIDTYKKEGAKIIASVATGKSLSRVHTYKKYYFVEMAKMFTHDTYPKLGTIDETFMDELTLKLQGGEEIILKEYNKPGISTNQTVALLPNKSLIVGDLIHHKAHAWLEGGIVNGNPQINISDWVELLKEIRSDFSPKLTIHGGRGKIGKITPVIDEQINYLEKANKLVESYIDSVNATELKTEKAYAHYKEISNLFKRNFPDYELNYMIEYGVYGLVNSKL